MFSLVSNRYERASMIVTDNKQLRGATASPLAATAVIDRLIHHSEILRPVELPC